MDFMTFYVCESAGNRAVRLEVQKVDKQQHPETQQMQFLTLTGHRPSDEALGLLHRWRDERQRVDVDGVRVSPLLIHEIDERRGQVSITMIDDKAERQMSSTRRRWQILRRRGQNGRAA